jgi:hypothetical protein
MGWLCFFKKVGVIFLLPMVKPYGNSYILLINMKKSINSFINLISPSAFIIIGLSINSARATTVLTGNTFSTVSDSVDRLQFKHAGGIVFGTGTTAANINNHPAILTNAANDLILDPKATNSRLRLDINDVILGPSSSSANNPWISTNASNDLIFDVNNTGKMLLYSGASTLAQPPTFKAGEGFSFVGTPGSWYRIAQSSANKGSAKFVLDLGEVAGSPATATPAVNQTITIQVGAGGSNAANDLFFQVISNNGNTVPLEFRIVGTTGTGYLEIKIPTNRTRCSYTIENNIGSSYSTTTSATVYPTWTPLNWTAGSIPSGYSSTLFNVNADTVSTSGPLLVSKNGITSQAAVSAPSLSTTGSITAGGPIGANGGLTVPTGQSLTVNGSLLAASGSIGGQSIATESQVATNYVSKTSINDFTVNPKLGDSNLRSLSVVGTPEPSKPYDFYKFALTSNLGSNTYSNLNIYGPYYSTTENGVVTNKGNLSNNWYLGTKKIATLTSELNSNNNPTSTYTKSKFALGSSKSGMSLYYDSTPGYFTYSGFYAGGDGNNLDSNSEPTDTLHDCSASLKVANIYTGSDTESVSYLLKHSREGFAHLSTSRTDGTAQTRLLFQSGYPQGIAPNSYKNGIIDIHTINGSNDGPSAEIKIGQENKTINADGSQTFVSSTTNVTLKNDASYINKLYLGFTKTNSNSYPANNKALYVNGDSNLSGNVQIGEPQVPVTLPTDVKNVIYGKTYIERIEPRGGISMGVYQ